MSSRFILPFADVGSGIKPSDGAQLFFFETGTSTPKDTFSDQLATPTPNANPVIADSKGVFGDIFIEGTYKVVLKDKNDVQIWEADPVESLSTFQESDAIDLSGLIFASVQDMKSGTGNTGTAFDFTKITIGSKFQWLGYYSGSDGGGNVGVLKTGAHTDDGGKIFSLSATLFIEADLTGIINILKFGAIGDGLTTKTDNRQVILNAFAALPQSKGVIELTTSSSGDSYFTSDSLTINQSNTSLNVLPGAELFCDADTTDGHTFAFTNPTTGQQNSNCHVFGGGTIRNSAPGTNENAIGFARISGYSCIGMNVPFANKKAITAQVDCDNGYIARNTVGITGSDGISVEGDSQGATQENNNITIIDNEIADAGGIGVNITFVAGPSTKNVKTGGNLIRKSDDHGMAFSGCDTIDLRGGDVVLDAGSRGFSFLNCNDILGRIRSLKSVNQGVIFDGCGGNIRVDVTTKDSSFGQSNVVDAIVVQSPTSTHEITAFISGSTHKSVLNSLSAASFPVHFIRPKIINDGLTSRYLGTIPFLDEGERKVRVTFADLDATPDVSTATLFKASNTAATTITTFDGSTAERLIEVFFVTTNTTMQHAGGGSLRLKGSVNVVPPVAGFMHFRFADGLWHEVARSF